MSPMRPTATKIRSNYAPAMFDDSFRDLCGLEVSPTIGGVPAVLRDPDRCRHCFFWLSLHFATLSLLHLTCTQRMPNLRKRRGPPKDVYSSGQINRLDSRREISLAAPNRDFWRMYSPTCAGLAGTGSFPGLDFPSRQNRPPSPCRCSPNEKGMSISVIDTTRWRRSPDQAGQRPRGNRSLPRRNDFVHSR